MFKINKSHIHNIDALRGEYKKYRSVKLPEILDKSDVEMLYQKLTSLPTSKDHYKPGQKLLGNVYKINVNQKLKYFLNHFVNDELISLLKDITDIPSLVPLQLDLYSQKADESHFLEWHTDLEEDDLAILGLSLPVSNENEFKGAKFEMRERGKEELINSICPKRGDMYLFDISPELEHRTSPITKGERVSLTYFFKAQGKRFSPGNS